jgi:CRISPR/Cas system CMR-associated protein Cmr1 (group 7 of RAMP superfamily)
VFSAWLEKDCLNEMQTQIRTVKTDANADTERVIKEEQIQRNVTHEDS